MNKSYKLAMLALSLTVLSCSTENGYSEFERTQAYFLDKLDGDLSPSQWWKTCVTLNVNVTTDSPVKMWLMSAETGGTLYDYMEIEESGEIKMSAPQGKGSTIYLVSVCGRQQKAQPIVLSGRSEEIIYVTFAGGNTHKAISKVTTQSQINDNRDDGTFSDEPDPVNQSLYGSSVNGDATLYQLTDEQKGDCATMMDLLSRESANAKTVMGLNVDYELESKGPFTITWIAGNCLSTTSHILGYYYHSPGTYDDIQYVDICETELYDVIDGLAKVQYQVNQTAVDMYPEDRLITDKWYAANFDMDDRWESPNSAMIARRGDNAWNAMGVFARYGRNISAVRGLSFTIDVPEGMRLGFYDRAENKPRPDQYDRLVQKKVRPYTDRDNFKGTSYSAEAMNTINPNGNFRSFIQPLKSMMWMGMENDISGGDLDCNDVIFGVTAKMDIYLPSVVEPDFFPSGEYTDLMPWTIAYEDVGREADFDFNDAVIKLVPDYENELCCVTVEAAGSPARMYLHYDGPDGDVNMGEIHELLSRNVGSKVNTTSYVPQTPFVEVDCVPWPKGYTMGQDAKRFWIEIQRGTCEDCTDAITLAMEPGQMPEALLVAGEWQWPMEGVHIFSAYNSFPNWAKDVSKTGYWGWYSSAKAGTVVTY